MPLRAPPTSPPLPRGAALVLLVLAALAGGPRRASAEGTDEHVEAALRAAGDNRPELERALAHFDALGDPQRIEAIRFLVANMPGKGYVVTELKDAEDRTVAFDPLAWPDLDAAQAELDRLEAEHGELHFARDHLVEDVKTITADFLVAHVEEAFAAWTSRPEGQRIAFPAFLEHVLPYRGSEEPIDAWLAPLRRRLAAVADEAGVAADPPALYRVVSKDAHAHVRFDDRYYLHPTDQAYGEMIESGHGRCEDITNMVTYAARSVGLATAADYTPAWAHRDNNHAWNVLLDADGRGADPANAHAAKVYRKTWSIQRDAFAFRMPEGREPPNRFLASTTYVDVTDQYAPTTDLEVVLDPAVAAGERFAWICVFNGGDWVAIHGGEIRDGRVVFTKMGRNIVYLPTVDDGTRIVPAAAPRIVQRNGTVAVLAATGGPTDLLAIAVRPAQRSADTGAVTPVSRLEVGHRYVLSAWREGGWQAVGAVVAGEAPPAFPGLPSDALLWLVEDGSRRLERPFTIEEGLPRFW